MGGRRSTMGGGPAMGVRWGPAIPSTESLYIFWTKSVQVMAFLAAPALISSSSYSFFTYHKLNSDHLEPLSGQSQKKHFWVKNRISTHGHLEFYFCMKNEKIKNRRTSVCNKANCSETDVFENAKKFFRWRK